MNPFSVVETHTEGEYFNVVIGATNFASSNMYARQRQFQEKYREQYQTLLSASRDKPEENAVFLLDPVGKGDKCALIFMRDGHFVPISVAAIISVVNVLIRLLNGGNPRAIRSTAQYSFETLAGNVDVDVSFKPETPRCDSGDSITVRNVPSFALELNYLFKVPEIGDVRADIAYGGLMCAFVDASSVGVSITNEQRPRLLEFGEKIKSYIRAQYTPVHPLDPMIYGVSTVVFTQNARRENGQQEALSVAFVTPGRLDRSSSGVVTSARLAVLCARGLIGEEVLVNHSLTGAAYCGRIIGETTVGEYRAILPVIQGRTWVTAIKHVSEPTPLRGGSYGPDLWGQASQTRMNVDDMENLWLPQRPQKRPSRRSELESRDPQQAPRQNQRQHQDHQQGPLPESQQVPRRPAGYNDHILTEHQQMRWLMPWRDKRGCKCWICFAYEIWNLPLTYGILSIVGGGWFLDICIQYRTDLFWFIPRTLVWALSWIVMLLPSLRFRFTI